MSVKAITSREQLLEIGKACPGKLVALNFWADWAEPCKHMGVVFEQLAADHPTATLLNVEAEEAEELAEQFGIESVPTFVLIKDGAVLETVMGASAPDLVAAVTKHIKGPYTLPLPGVPPVKASVPAPAAPAPAPHTAPPTQPTPEQPPAVADEKRLKGLVNYGKVMLFMKGSPEEPRCGFSRQIVEILKEEGCTYEHFDILTDDEVRQGLKAFSNWPTFPQLYVDGQLVGGLDIIKELKEEGELQETLEGQSLKEVLEGLINQDKVMLFMKGSPEAPRCGFSRQVVEILKEEGCTYGHFDILSNEVVRQGLKTHSNWPTFPQLYVDGTLVGGLDILKELKEEGELQETLCGE